MTWLGVTHAFVASFKPLELRNPPLHGTHAHRSELGSHVCGYVPHVVPLEDTHIFGNDWMEQFTADFRLGNSFYELERLFDKKALLQYTFRYLVLRREAIFYSLIESPERGKCIENNPP